MHVLLKLLISTMRHLILCLLMALASCDSAVTTRFETVNEARSKGALERGWLPPLLPDSARNIVEKNDLDLNIGEGTFQFDPVDYSTFVVRLLPASPESRASDRAEGFSIFTYKKENTMWILAVHPREEARYSMGLMVTPNPAKVR